MLEEKPILSYYEIMKQLGIEEVNERQFKELLNSVYSFPKREATPFGIYKEYCYAKKPLVGIAEKEIKKEDKADLYKIATELFVHPEIVTGIYNLLAFEGAIKGVIVTNEGVITKTQDRIFGRFYQ